MGLDERPRAVAEGAVVISDGLRWRPVAPRPRLAAADPSARGAPVIVSDASDAARRSCVRLGAFGGWTAAALAPPGRRGVGSGTAAFGFGTLGCGSCMRTATACRSDL